MNFSQENLRTNGVMNFVTCWRIQAQSPISTQHYRCGSCTSYWVSCYVAGIHPGKFAEEFLVCICSCCVLPLYNVCTYICTLSIFRGPMRLWYSVYWCVSSWEEYKMVQILAEMLLVVLGRETGHVMHLVICIMLQWLNAKIYQGCEIPFLSIMIHVQVIVR